MTNAEHMFRVNHGRAPQRGKMHRVTLKRKIEHTSLRKDERISKLAILGAFQKTSVSKKHLADLKEVYGDNVPQSATYSYKEKRQVNHKVLLRNLALICTHTHIRVRRAALFAISVCG